MRPFAGRASLELAVPVALAATVFAFACGSSSVHALTQVGKPLRWAALVVLLALAAARAAEPGVRRALARAVPPGTTAASGVAAATVPFALTLVFVVL